MMFKLWKKATIVSKSAMQSNPTLFMNRDGGPLESHNSKGVYLSSVVTAIGGVSISYRCFKHNSRQ